MAGLLTYAGFVWPSHPFSGQWLNETKLFIPEVRLAGMALTAAGTVRDFHPVPF